MERLSRAAVWLTLSVCSGARFERLPMEIEPGFEENRGQADATIQYLEVTNQLAMSCGSLRRPRDPNAGAVRGNRGALVGLTFEGTSPACEARLEDPVPVSVNVYRGPQRAGWIEGIRRYRRLTFRGVYPGIDASFRFADGNLVWSWTIQPGAVANSILMRFDPDTVRDGVLEEVGRHFGFGAPRAAQTPAAGSRELPVKLALTTFTKLLTFEVAAPDPSLPVTIELMAKAAAKDLATGASPGKDGRWFGSFSSLGYRSLGASPILCNTGGSYMTLGYCTDAAVSGFGGDAPTVITYLAGERLDRAGNVSSDGLGSVYMGGMTYSADFPATNGAFQRQYAGPSAMAVTRLTIIREWNYPGGDGFLAKFDETDLQLRALTYLGSDASEPGAFVTAAGDGTLLVAATTGLVLRPEFGAPSRASVRAIVFNGDLSSIRIRESFFPTEMAVCSPPG